MDNCRFLEFEYFSELSNNLDYHNNSSIPKAPSETHDLINMIIMIQDCELCLIFMNLGQFIEFLLPPLQIFADRYYSKVMENE